MCGVGVSFNMSVCVWVSLFSVSFIVWVFELYFWCGYVCPRMRGGVVDGIHGEGGFIRKIPDSGGVRWCLVGLSGIGEGDCVVGLVVCSVGVCVWVCVYTFIVGVSFMVGVRGCECLSDSYMMSVWCGCGVMSCCKCGVGLWCPSMRGGDDVGDQGGGC